MFYAKSKEVLDLVEGLTSTEPVKKTLSIGLSEVLAVFCSGLIVKDLKSTVNIYQSDVGEVEKGLLNGDLDFGIVSVLKPSPKLDYLHLGKVWFGPFVEKKYMINLAKMCLTQYHFTTFHLTLWGTRFEMVGLRI